MLIFAGHHVKSQGATNKFSSELIESSILCGLISADGNSYFVGSATVKDKIEVINTVCDSLSIDIHYTTSIDGPHGPKVYYKDGCDYSKRAAFWMQHELNEVSFNGNNAEIGYYHGQKEFGYDTFLKNDHPSIIICPEHWDNYKSITTNRARYSGAIQRGINRLREYNG